MKQRSGRNKQTGFAHPGIIIAILLVVAALAFGGWYVWNKNNEDKKTDDSTAQNSNEEAQKEKKQEVPEGWKLYSNSLASFSFYYPPEWGEVKDTGFGSLKFSSLDGLLFQMNRRDKEHTQGHFGVQKDNVIDVSSSGDEAIATFVTGIDPPHTKQIFTKDKILNKLSDSKACVLDDISVYEAYMNDPELINSHMFFGYCGLINPTYGAVAFSSDSLDITKASTRQLKEELTILLKTFDFE